MRNKFCPNLSHPNAKALIEKVGLLGFYREYILNNYTIPSMEYIESIPEVKTQEGPIINNQSNVQYQLPQGREIEEFVASEKTIRDLAARMSDRIGIPVRFESDRSKEYKGKLENGTAVVNLAYATLDTPIHEILGHPIIRAIKNPTLSERSSQSALLEYKNAFIVEENGEFFIKKEDGSYWSNFETKEEAEKELKILQKANSNETSQLYQNLLKELEYGKGKEVLDRVKRDYVYKSAIDFNTTEIKNGEPTSTKEYSKILEYAKKEGFYNEDPFSTGDFTKERTFSIDGETYKTTVYKDGSSSISKLPKYTLEEQQEEALVELLGLYTAGKLDNVKDGKLISLLKRLLKEMKAFMKELLSQREIEIDKLPDNMTLGDIADLLAYSNSKLILPGNEVVYTTPDNQQFKTYQEASNHISQLAKSVEDVNLSDVILNLTPNFLETVSGFIIEKDSKGYFFNLKSIKPTKTLKDAYFNTNFLIDNYNYPVEYLTKEEFEKETNEKIVGNPVINKIIGNYVYEHSVGIDFIGTEDTFYRVPVKHYISEELYKKIEREDNRFTKGDIPDEYGGGTYDLDTPITPLKDFIEKNKQYEQSKEIIEEWKKVNNIQYNPEEVYSRGQGFYSAFAAYSDLDLDTLMANILHHIEDNEKAGGKFALSAFTKSIDKTIRHIEKSGLNFKIFPKPEHIMWAANTDVFSGSVWDASEKVNKDKKSELLGVSYTKYPSLQNVSSVQPNLASIIDDLAHHHNELGIQLTGNNFRLEINKEVLNETDGKEYYKIKAWVDKINSILDQKYGKLVKPEIKQKEFGTKYIVKEESAYGDFKTIVFNTEKEALDYKKSMAQHEDIAVKISRQTGIQPSQTNETLKESINSVHSKVYLQNRTIVRKINDINQVPKKFKAKDQSNKEVIIEKQEDGRWIGGVLGEYKYYLTEDIVLDAYNKSLGNIKEKEYTEQALINTKIAKLKEVAKKYPRSLIRSEVRPIPRYEKGDEYYEPFKDELPFQKISKSPEQDNENTSIEDILFVNKDLFDAYKQDQILESLTYLIYENSLNNIGIEASKEDILNKFKETENYIRNNEDNPDTDLANVYQDIIDNYDNFYNRAIKKLEDKGLVKESTLEIENEDENYNPEDDNNLYQDSYYQRLNYSDDFNFSLPSSKSASERIRLALSFIPKYQVKDGKIEVDEDGDYVKELNFLGLSTYEDPDILWKDLLYTLHTIPNGDKLDYLGNVSKNTKHKIVYRQIMDNPNTEIRNEFESVFTKQQAKFVTPNIGKPDPTGNRALTVYDTNRANSSNIIIDNWFNNFLSSSIVKTSPEGVLYADSSLGMQLLNAYNKALELYASDANKGIDNIVKILNKIGINITPEVFLNTESIYVDGANIATEAFLKNHLKYIVSNLSVENTDGSDINNPFINEGSTLNALAKLENEINPTIFEDSMISGDGKAKYSFVNHSYVSKLMLELQRDTEYASKLKETAYASGSLWLDRLTGPRRELFLKNFGLHYFDTLGNSASNQVNKPFGKMNTMEKEFTRISMFQNNGNLTGYFFGLTPSDKSTLYTVKAPKITLKGYSKTGELSPAIKKLILDQVKSEYLRVQQTIKDSKDPNIVNIKDYHNGMGEKFIVFPFLNDLLIENGNLLGWAPSVENDIIWPAVKENFDKIINNTIDYWKEQGLWNKDILDIKYANELGKVEGLLTKAQINKLSEEELAKYNSDIQAKFEPLLTDLAANYSVNYFIAYHNMTQVISGDPALHGKSSIEATWDNYYKRMAKDIAPGIEGAWKDNATFNTVFLEDIEYMSDHLNEYMEKVGGYLNRAYSSINPADAQEYTTLQEHLAVLDSLGRLTKEHREAADRLLEGNNSYSNIDTLYNKGLSFTETSLNKLKSQLNIDFNNKDFIEAGVNYENGKFNATFEILHRDKINDKIEEEVYNNIIRPALDLGSLDYIKTDTTYKISIEGETVLIELNDISSEIGNSILKASNEYKENDSSLNEDINLILQPMKPVYVGTKIENGVSVMYYIKTSSFPLIPALTRGLEIDKLRLAMENPKQPIDRAVYTSGVKLGLRTNPVKITKDGGNTISELTINPNQIYTLERKGFRIQQENPFHGLTGNINEGSQGRKLVLSNVPNTRSFIFNKNNKYTGLELKSIYDNLHKEKVNRAWDKVVKDLDIDPKTGRFKNINKIQEILKQEALDRDYSLNDIYSIQLVTDKDGKRRFKVPLGFVNNSMRLESILNSIVTNRVIKSELPGMMLIQAASTGFTKLPQYTSDENILSYKGAITWVNPKETKLNYIREENGRLLSADILVPNYFKGINIRDYMVGGYLDMNAIPEELLTIIGLRIPTQGKNSMMKFRVKGFLPDWMGEMTVVPAEIVAQMGSDFDVDKLFLYRYHFNKDKDGNLKKVSTYLPNSAYEIAYNKLSDEQIDNLIIQMFEDILSDPYFYPEILEPNGFGKLEKVVEEVKKISPSNNIEHQFTSRAQNYMYETNADGKMGVAIFSLFSTFYRTAQDFNLYTRSPILSVRNSKGEVKELSSLNNTETIENTSVSNTIMYLQSASVDNAKEQLLGPLNINDITMQEAGVMALLGLPEDFIGLFTAQPIIKEYVEIIKNNGNIVNGEYISNIKEYARQTLINNYLGEDSIVDFKILDKIVYDINMLKEGIAQKNFKKESLTNLSPEELSAINNAYAYFQIKILTDFMKISRVGEEVRTIQSVLSTDTKGLGSNIISLNDKVNKFNNLLNVRSLPYREIVNIEKIFGYNLEEYTSNSGETSYKLSSNPETLTYDGKLQHILRDSAQSFKWLFPYETISYSAVINKIVEGVGITPNENNIRHIATEIKSFLLNNEDILGENPVTARRRLLMNENSLADRWVEYSNTPEGKINPLTKRILPNKSKDTEAPQRLKALNTPASNSKTDINNSIMYFYNMLNSENTVEKELAIDLVKYHLVTGGQYGPNSIGKYITFDFLDRNFGFSDKLRELNIKLYTGEESLANFITQYFQNNPFKAFYFNTGNNANTYVTKIEDMPKTKDGNVPTYFVSYDSNSSQPILYGLDSMEMGVLNYVKIPINPFNKQVKAYDKNKDVFSTFTSTENVVPEEVVYENASDTEIVSSDTVALNNAYSLENNNIIETLDIIMENNKGSYRSTIANKIKESLNNLGLNIKIKIGGDAEALGSFVPGLSTIYINTELLSLKSNANALTEETILHEALHALTVELFKDDNTNLSKKQFTARNKIKRLFNEYRKTVDQEELAKYEEILSKPVKTSEERAYLVENKRKYYHLTSIEEFVANSLTNPELINTLKSNNLWKNLVEFLSELFGIVSNDLELLVNSTMDLIAGSADISTDIKADNNSNQLRLFNINENNYTEAERLEFLRQRDLFFKNWNIKNYWDNPFKRYRAETQAKYLAANNNPLYDRLIIKFFDNQLRVKYTPKKSYNTDIQENTTFFNMDEAENITSETRLIDKLIKTYTSNLLSLINTRRKLGEGVDPKLDQEIEKTEQKLEQLQSSKSLSAVYETTKAKLNEMAKTLKQEDVPMYILIDISGYINEFLTINDTVDFDTTDEDGVGTNYNSRFNQLAGTAREVSKLLVNKQKQVLERWGQVQLGKSPADMQVNELIEKGIKDVGKIESHTLSFAQSSSTHIQNIGHMIAKAQMDANDSYNDKMNEFEEILKNYKDKYGKDFSILLEKDSDGKPTGYLLNRYKREYFEKSTDKNFVRNNSKIVITQEGKDRYLFDLENAKVAYEGDPDGLAKWIKNHDPNVYINRYKKYNIEYNRDRYPAARYTRLLPDEKWQDPNYNNIMNKPADDPAVVLYNYLQPLYANLNRKYSNNINYIPEVELNSRELLLKGNIKGGINKLANEWVYNYDDILGDTRSTDDKRADVIINNITVEPRLHIPVKMFGGKLSPDSKSLDLGRVTSAILHQEESIKAKMEVEPILNMYYSLIKNANSIIKYKGEEVTVNRQASNTAEHALFLINSYLYGKTRSDSEAEEKYGKASDTIINYMRVAGMGWNIFSAIGNISQGFNSHYIFGSGGQYFNIKEVTRAYGINLAQLGGDKKSLKKIAKAFRFTDALVLTHEMNFGTDRRISNLDRFQGSDWMAPFYAIERGEYFNQGTTMVAVMLGEKVKNLKGETKSLWDAFDENMNWKTEEFGENPYTDGSTLKYKLQAKIRTAIENVHGNYAREMQVKKHFWGRLMMPFRTWLPQAIHNRFGEETRDSLTGAVTKGRYRSAINFFKNEEDKFDFKALQSNIAWMLRLSKNSTLSDVDKMNMRKNIAELLLLAGVFISMQILGAFNDDDDPVLNYLMNHLYRNYSELSMFMLPTSWDQIIKDPIPPMNVIRQTGNTLNAIIDHIQGDGYYTSGPWEGESKVFRNTIKQIPLFKQPWQQYEYSAKLFSDYAR